MLGRTRARCPLWLIRRASGGAATGSAVRLRVSVACSATMAGASRRRSHRCGAGAAFSNIPRRRTRSRLTAWVGLPRVAAGYRRTRSVAGRAASSKVTTGTGRARRPGCRFGGGARRACGWTRGSILRRNGARRAIRGVFPSSVSLVVSAGQRRCRSAICSSRSRGRRFLRKAQGAAYERRACLAIGTLAARSGGSSLPRVRRALVVGARGAPLPSDGYRRRGGQRGRARGGSGAGGRPGAGARGLAASAGRGARAVGGVAVRPPG